MFVLTWMFGVRLLLMLILRMLWAIAVTWVLLTVDLLLRWFVFYIGVWFSVGVCCRRFFELIGVLFKNFVFDLVLDVC